MSLESFDQTVLREHHAAVRLDDGFIYIYTRKEIPEDSDLRNLLGFVSESHDSYWIHKARFATLNAFALRHALKGKKTHISSDDGRQLAELADRVELPRAELAEDEKSVMLYAPNLKVYKDLFARLGTWPTKNGQRLRLDRVIDFENANNAWRSNLPAFQVEKRVRALTNEPIPGFDGTIDSLREIPIGALNIVRANVQRVADLKKSKASLEDKLAKFGLSTLHDLLFRLPRRYIDKSQPQLIDDLIEGETATIIGRIAGMTEVTNGTPALRIVVEDATGQKISCTFWRQVWLKTKFKIGNEVIVTGGYSIWRDTPQLTGHSIEHFDENVTLPVVPIYRQSGSAGITSGFLINAVRELLQRIGDIKLPTYLKAEGRLPYKDILTELHLPTNLVEHQNAVNAMAYYELIYMQLLIQDSKNNVETRPGVALQRVSRGLQQKAIESLPFKPTGDQSKAVELLNKGLASNKPNTSLLMADVGAGKTLVAQLAALQVVDGGAQAVIVGPTEILAKQLYANFRKLTEEIENNFGEKVVVEFLGGGMKARERKELLARIASGEVDIVVGTQSVFADTVAYHNLGLVVIDEQQKFGAEQRTKLLNVREDGRVPDLLMQTATPIPRSTAQIYYGDIDPIIMTEKPAGRIPIETVWLQEDPLGISREHLHPLWLDIQNEAKKGHQTFVITPMVQDSEKVDAASVIGTYKALSEGPLSTVRVAHVYGSMKKEEQEETMEKFRAGEIDVLVASTVIEVGVDIPNATRMVILSADRMGASSLHQIRGRIGRNSLPSKCYLVSLGKTESAQSRLQAMVDYEDGFEISRVDLEVRGEGTMFSTDQSGRSDMIFANLRKHSHLIDEAREEAQRILRSPFKEKALADAREKFMSTERLF